jgi:molecular chaperone GrpE
MENQNEASDTERKPEKPLENDGIEPGDGNLNTENSDSAAQIQAGAVKNDEKPESERTPEEKIACFERQNAELKDQFLRKAADFENYRKRSIKERAEAIDYANQSLLLDLIPILDDFDRALLAAESAEKSGTDFDNLKAGVKITAGRLYTTLENKWGLKRFDSAGAVFDPARHEALASETSADVAEATVADDFVKGYTLKDRVIRPAKVKVLMPESGN